MKLVELMVFPKVFIPRAGGDITRGDGTGGESVGMPRQGLPLVGACVMLEGMVSTCEAPVKAARLVLAPEIGLLCAPLSFLRHNGCNHGSSPALLGEHVWRYGTKNCPPKQGREDSDSEMHIRQWTL